MEPEKPATLMDLQCQAKLGVGKASPRTDDLGEFSDFIKFRLFMDSRLLAQQQTEEGIHEPFAAIFGIVDKLEEAEIKRQVLLRDSAVGSQPGMQQGSEPFHRVDMDFVEAITVFVTGILPGVMADRFVLKAPFG